MCEECYESHFQEVGIPGADAECDSLNLTRPMSFVKELEEIMLSGASLVSTCISCFFYWFEDGISRLSLLASWLISFNLLFNAVMMRFEIRAIRRLSEIRTHLADVALSRYAQGYFVGREDEERELSEIKKLFDVLEARQSSQASHRMDIHTESKVIGVENSGASMRSSSSLATKTLCDKDECVEQRLFLAKTESIIKKLRMRIGNLERRKAANESKVRNMQYLEKFTRYESSLRETAPPSIFWGKLKKERNLLCHVPMHVIQPDIMIILDHWVKKSDKKRHPKKNNGQETLTAAI